MPSNVPSNKDYIISVLAEMQPNHRNKFPSDETMLTGNLVWDTLAGDIDLRREFFSGLLYKWMASVTSRRNFNNDLAEFIEDATRMTGAVVEEYYIDKLESKRVEITQPSELLKIETLSVYDTYHTINRPLEKYAYTLSPLRMKKALLNEGGINSFLEDAARTLNNSKEKDDKDYVLAVIGDYVQACQSANRLYSVQCDFDKNQPSTVIEEQVKKIAAEARKIYSEFQIDMTRIYNPLGVMNFAEKDEVLLFIKPELEAYMNVFVEAMAFNMEKTGFAGKIMVVPNFGANVDPDALAIVTTREFFKCWKTVDKYSMFFDPDLQTDKYYYHVEGIFSSSMFENFAIITKGAGTEVPFIQISNFGASATAAGTDILGFGSILTDENAHKLNISIASANLPNPDTDVDTTLEYELRSYQGEVKDSDIATITWDGSTNDGLITVTGNGYLTMTVKSVYNPNVYRTIRYELRLKK